MDVLNPLYENQGIHVIASIFTVEEGIVKILLIKRKKEPFKGMWILSGGAAYNNEDTDTAIRRELKEKTGIEDIHLEQYYAFSEPNRAPQKRMIAIGYLGVIDSSKVELLKETEKTEDCGWFAIDKIPPLGYDHEIILKKSLEILRKKIMKSNIASVLLPDKFTLSELQNVYELIVGETFDRRNFRRKFLNLMLIEPAGGYKEAPGKKPAIYYHFRNKEYEEIDIF